MLGLSCPGCRVCFSFQIPGFGPSLHEREKRPREGKGWARVTEQGVQGAKKSKGCVLQGGVMELQRHTCVRYELCPGWRRGVLIPWDQLSAYSPPFQH